MSYADTLRKVKADPELPDLGASVSAKEGICCWN